MKDLTPAIYYLLFTIYDERPDPSYFNHGGIPFEVRVQQPNQTSIAAMKELDEGKGHSAESVSTLMNELTDGKVSDV